MLGTLLGAYSARHYPSKVDNVITGVSLSLYAMPIFWSGLLLILIFAVTAALAAGVGDVQPQRRRRDGIGRALDIARHMVLPTTALFLYSLPRTCV